jgi:hypothetical protein
MIRGVGPMASIAHGLARERRRMPRGARGIVLFAIILSIASCALAFVGYVLWPRWPVAEVARDAPALPITVAGVTFNVPPAAIRVAMQRRAGTQERIDLVFLWPSLTPPDPAARPAPGAPPASPFDRIFLTIAGSDGGLAPVERRTIIYPRYATREPGAGPEGLAVLAFRNGTPYQGEDLVYELTAPERFFARCTRGNGATPGTCLREQRIGAAELSVRFPRAWLDDWRTVAQGIDRLIADLHPSAG